MNSLSEVSRRTGRSRRFSLRKTAFSSSSWYLVTTEDRMIPPSAQREMSERAGSAVVEVTGSHAIYVSQPETVAELIEKAASEVKSAVRTA